MARRHGFAAVLLAAALGACADGPVTARETRADGPAPLLKAAPNARVLKDRYIVVLRGWAVRPAEAADRLEATPGVTVHHVYQHALRGFAATLTPAALQALRNDPDVAFIEPDLRVRATAITQPKAPWHLDRDDQRVSTRDNEYSYAYTGSGVRVYVIDTGIDTSHPLFGGRAAFGADFCPGCGALDPHGTMVAGVLGSSRYGVAKGASLYSVRVLDSIGDGSASNVAAALDWVTLQKMSSPSVPMVANLSIIFDLHAALDSAVNRAIARGVVVVAGAGNENVDACGYSPAHLSAVITVGGVNKAEAKVANSNHGSCVDLYAPGDQIKTTFPGGDSVSIGGTSMAAPQAAGFAAMYLHAFPNASPATVHAEAVGLATTGVISGLPAGSNNRLLFTWFMPHVTVTELARSSPTVITAKGFAYTGTGNVQPEWKDVTAGGSFAFAPSVPPAADGRWTAAIPATNPCHTYEVRARYGGVVSASRTHNGLALGQCPDSARVIWIQPAWLAGSMWTPGALAVAGSAKNAPAGTPVKLWYKPFGGAWTKVAYEPVTDAGGIWLNEIPGANFLQSYDVQVEYDVIESAICTYPGTNDIKWC